MSLRSQGDVISRIKKQFLCQTPIIDLAWNDILNNLTQDVVIQIVDNTVNYKSNLKYPLKLEYQKAFMKDLTRIVQEHNIDAEDHLYEALGKLFTVKQGIYSYKHYYMEKKEIVLKESISIISNGTTGLCSWPASLALSEWVLTNKQKFRDKTVLELGSGTGLAGLVVALCCDSKAVFLTDCHTSVLSNLCENVALNIPTEVDCCLPAFQQSNTYDGTKVNVMKVPWEDVNDGVAETIKPDFVIASDIIYDKDLFEPLLNALKHFAKNDGVEVILSCTERNEETLRSFLEDASSAGFVIDALQTPKQKDFVWTETIPIKLFLLKR